MIYFLTRFLSGWMSVQEETKKNLQGGGELNGQLSRAIAASDQWLAAPGSVGVFEAVWPVWGVMWVT